MMAGVCGGFSVFQLERRLVKFRARNESLGNVGIEEIFEVKGVKRSPRGSM